MPDLASTVAGTATIGGTSFPVVSWTVDGDITSDLPEQLRDFSGSTVARCQLELAPPSGSTPGWWSPWRRRQQVGADVQVYATLDGDTWLPVFTGTVQQEAGSTSDGAGRFSCLDLADWLHQPVTLDAVPASVDGWIHPGMSPQWVIGHVIRQAGWTPTPSAPDGTVVSATLLGSTWPEVGRLTVSNGPVGSPPTFAEAPWGLALADGGCSWAPSSVLRLDGTTVVTMLVEGAGTGYVALRLYDPAGSPPHAPKVSIGYDGGTVTVTGGSQVSGTHPGGLLTVTLTRNGDDLDVTWDGGTGTITVPEDADDRVWWVDAGSSGALLGGLVVAPTAAPHDPNAVLDVPVGLLDAIPAVDTADGWDVVRDVATAEQGAVWVDPDGTFRFASRHTLRGIDATPVPVTSTDTIANLSWIVSDNQLAGTAEVPVASTTVVVHLDGQGNALQTVPVWQADRPVRVNPQRTVRLLVDLDGGAYDLDTTLRRRDDGRSWYRANTAPDGSGDSVPLSSVQVVRVGVSQARITLRNRTGDRLWLVDSDGQPALRLSARARVDQDDTFTVVHSNETGHPAVVDVPPSPWRQDADAAETLARWLAYETAAPAPQLRDVQVLPDLARTRGDIIRLTDDHATGADVRAVVVGLRLEGEAGRLSQTLTVRPLAATYAEFTTRYDGLTFEQFNDLWDGATFADFALSPLEP